MSYLPPGWTEDRLQIVSVDDLRQLSEEQIRQIDENSIPRREDNVQVHIAIGRAKLNEHRRLEREKLGLPPAPPRSIYEKNDDPIVELVERHGFDDFGFITFRTYYSDEQLWEQWGEKYIRIIDTSMEESSGGHKIEDKCLMPTFEDEELDGAGYHRIQQEYYEYLETVGVPPGLDVGVCLVADKAAIESMQSEKPWVYALDMSFDHSEDIPDGTYPGYFRVAVESIIPDLYPMLPAMTPRELWSPEITIWETAFVSQVSGD